MILILSGWWYGRDAPLRYAVVHSRFLYCMDRAKMLQLIMDPQILQTTRRQFFGRTARGIGTLALASLVNPGLLRAAEAAAAKPQRWLGIANPPPLIPKARRVIYLTMAGGP